jgi:hypothetical protein
MEDYRIFFVATLKPRPGKSSDLAKWWEEKGRATYESMPGISSVKAYASQFGLGDEYGLEIWMEMENYGTLDRIDEDLVANIGKYAAFAETSELFEGGPARIMGEWPKSHWSAEEG